MTQALNSPTDSQKLREDLIQTRENIRNIIQSTTNLLNYQPPPNEADERNALLASFSEVVSQCKQVCNISIQKERSFPLRNAMVDTYGISEAKAREFEASVPSQLTFVESQEVHVDNEIIKEGNSSMARVYDDLKHLREISEDTALLVETQSGMIDFAEKKSAASAARSKRAVATLETAMKHQSKSRRKYCCIIIIILAAVLLIAFIIAVFVGIF